MTAVIESLAARRCLHALTQSIEARRVAAREKRLRDDLELRERVARFSLAEIQLKHGPLFTHVRESLLTAIEWAIVAQRARGERLDYAAALALALGDLRHVTELAARVGDREDEVGTQFDRLRETFGSALWTSEPG